MSESYINTDWFHTRNDKLSVKLDMVNAERNVCLAVREYVYAWEMASVMVYIKDHMDNMYSEIDMVSRYINLKVNCFLQTG